MAFAENPAGKEKVIMRTPKNYEGVENTLASLKDRLVQELKERLEQCRVSSANDSSELLDLAADGELDEMAVRIIEADSLKINEIEEALHMLREGRYGICQRCGQKIASRRLKAIPFATLCIECKQKEEQNRLALDSGGERPRRPAHVEIDLTEREQGETSLEDIWNDVELHDVY